MKRGCVIAAVVMVALCLIVFSGVLFAVGAFPAAGRAPVAEMLTQDTVLAAYVDTQDPVIGGIVDALARTKGAPGGVAGMFMPHEAGVILDMPPGGDSVALRLAVSARRFGPILKGLLATASEEQPFLQGSALTLEDNGRLVLTKGQSVPPEALDVAAERWAQAEGGPLALEGGHFFEMAVDNQCGRGYLAIQALLAGQSTPAPVDDATDTGVEKQQVFDADELSGLFYRVKGVHIVGRFVSEDELSISLDIECPDARAAETIHFAVLTTRDFIFRQLIEQGVVLEGEPVIDGARVRGQLRLLGIGNLI